MVLRLKGSTTQDRSIAEGESANEHKRVWRIVRHQVPFVYRTGDDLGSDGEVTRHSSSPGSLSGAGRKALLRETESLGSCVFF